MQVNANLLCFSLKWFTRSTRSLRWSVTAHSCLSSSYVAIVPSLRTRQEFEIWHHVYILRTQLHGIFSSFEHINRRSPLAALTFFTHVPVSETRAFSVAGPYEWNSRQPGCSQRRIQDLGLEGGVECEASKAPRNKAPKAPRGGVWEGVPLPVGVEVWGGHSPLHKFV